MRMLFFFSRKIQFHCQKHELTEAIDTLWFIVDFHFKAPV